MSNEMESGIKTSFLSPEQLAALHKKYGRPGEIAPGLPGKKSKRTFYKKEEETVADTGLENQKK